MIKRTQFPIAAHAAAEPAPERTQPQDDTASICSQFYDRWERPGIPFYDFLQFAKKLRAVAVPEPAAQQESIRDIYNAREWPEADKWCKENRWPIGLPVYHSGGYGYQYLPAILTAYDRRARQAEPAPKPSRPLKTGDKCIIRGTVVGIQAVDIGWSPTCENVLEVMLSDQLSIWLRESNVVAEASALGTKEKQSK